MMMLLDDEFSDHGHVAVMGMGVGAAVDAADKGKGAFAIGDEFDAFCFVGLEFFDDLIFR